MRCKLSLLFATLLVFDGAISLAEPTAGDTQNTIVIDGEFEDWVQIPNAAVRRSAAARHPLFVKSIRIHHDAKSVFVFFELSRPVSLQQMADAARRVGRLTILFDADGKKGTGWVENNMEGVDLAIDFPPRDNENALSSGVAIRARTEQSRSQRTLSAYPIGFLSAPTFAADKFEIRLQRGPLEIGDESLRLFDEQFQCKVCLTDTCSGLALNELLSPTYGLSMRSKTESIVSRVAPLGRSRPDLTRMVVWNTGVSGLLDEKRASSFRSVVSALNPDVVLLTEILGDCSAVGPQNVPEHYRRWIPQSADITAVVQRLMSSATGTQDHDWNVVLSTNGSIERTLVGSRLPLQRIDEFDDIFPAPLKSRFTTVGGIVHVGNHQILMVPVDFQSKSERPGDEKDRDRLSQVSAVKKAVMQAVSRHQIDGVIIGGDFNLVGSRTPLDRLISLSPFGTGEMKVVRATQLDGLSNTTWSARRRDTPTFGPGRLDFVLRTESPLMVANAFAFESGDLSPEWQKHYALSKADTEAFSDHLPIVVDLAVTEAD